MQKKSKSRDLNKGKTYLSNNVIQALLQFFDSIKNVHMSSNTPEVTVSEQKKAETKPIFCDRSGW